MTHRTKLIPGALAATALALVAALSLNVTGASADPGSPAVLDGPEVVPGETLILFEDPTVADRVIRSAEQSDALEAEVLTDDLAGQTIVNVTTDTPGKAEALIGAAEALPGVTAQPNYVYRLLDEELDLRPVGMATGTIDELEAETESEIAEGAVDALALPTTYPNDKYAKLQYALLDIGNGATKSGANILEAWDAVRTQENPSSVTVAVIDSGVNANHEDLQVKLNLDLAYDVFSHTDDVKDEIGHGTGGAGVIVASANNGLGIAGVAGALEHQVTVLPIKIFKDSGETSTSKIVEGLDYLDQLVEDGKLTDLRVINMSLGLREQSEPGKYDIAMHDFVDHFTADHDVLVVGAGGNGDEDNHNKPITTPMYPADYDGCLSVTALSETGANAWFSDYNLLKDISAPGVDIAFPSEDDDHGYVYGSGTSYSAPIASGVAALMYSVNPALTPAEAIEIIKETAAPLPDTSELNWGELTGSAGALDAGAALRETLRRAGAEEPVTGIAVYRLYNPFTTEHLFTTDRAEYDTLGELGWNREGVAWQSPEEGVPVYRLYNGFNDDHLYTTSLEEYEALEAIGWQGEDVKMWSSEEGQSIKRLYNPFCTENGGAYAHLWTADENEYAQLASTGWTPEGTAWHALG